jgi:uracil-DNA glycosylase
LDREADQGADRLADLLVRIRACRICITHPAGAPLPHAPRPIIRASVTAKIAVCGQAPGTRVHASGLPFDDRSGDRLRSWMGVDRATFYDEAQIATVPMGFCFPGTGKTGADLPPRAECAALWRAAVFEALPNLELLLLVGSYAIAWHLPDRARRPMAETVADWSTILDDPGAGGPAKLPLPHPSWRNTGWLKANSWFERDVVPVVRSRVRLLLR